MIMEQFSEFVANNIFLFIALIVILTLIIRSYIVTSGAKNVTASDAVRMVNRDDAVIVDVRTEEEFRNGHILNASNIPLGLLESRSQELQKYKSHPLIIVCKSGNRSHQAAGILKKQGFEQIFNLSGGMLSWESANLPVES